MTLRPNQSIVVACLVLATAAMAQGKDVPGTFPLPDDESAARFLKKLQDAVGAHDAQRVADLVKFPVLVRLDGKDQRIGRKTFVARYEEVFTGKVKSAVLNARFESQAKYGGVWWNWQGVMVGRGELWFAAYDDGTIKVKTVNN